MNNIDINELKKTDAFKVPENYFDTLTDRVMSKIPAEDTKVISINQGKKNSMGWWKWSSIAACIAMVIVGTVFINKSTNSQSEEFTSGLAYVDEQSQEEMIMEYTMLDANDVYCYLSGDSY